MKKNKSISSKKSFWCDESGASAVEYGLLLASITLVLVLAFTELGDKAKSLFSSITQKITDQTANIDD
jgi:Flp pilus assembly pilin Flp